MIEVKKFNSLTSFKLISFLQLSCCVTDKRVMVTVMEEMVDTGNTNLNQAMEAINNHNNSMEVMDINNDEEENIIQLLNVYQ